MKDVRKENQKMRAHVAGVTERMKGVRYRVRENGSVGGGQLNNNFKLLMTVNLKIKNMFKIATKTCLP